ncbi:MAG: hypothetical protein OXI79_14325 [Gammaproteobacteria bacterium]|nr:hypothetical protein [Gammaproteobacteria bacterium]
MEAAVIDTLRFADRLKEAGFDPPKADGLARALGEELGDRVLTRNDRDALGMRIDGLDAKFDARFEGLEAKFDAKFDGLDAKFDGLEAKFDGLEARFEGLEARFEGLEARFVGLEAKFDTQFESLRTNIKASHGRVGDRFFSRHRRRHVQRRGDLGSSMTALALRHGGLTVARLPGHSLKHWSNPRRMPRAGLRDSVVHLSEINNLRCSAHIGMRVAL